MFNKILVCLDGSDIAEQILPYATEQALHFNSKVVLLQVITTPTGMVVPGIPGEPSQPMQPTAMLELVKKEEDEAGAYLAQMAEMLKAKGVEVEWTTVQGTPGSSIIQYTDENEVDLIAIATHGRGGLRRLVFGSVAEFVLKESGLPVLVIRPKESET